MNLFVRKARGTGRGWELWNGVKFIGHYNTNRAAWRAADKLSGEATSRREELVEWINRKD